MAAVWIPFRDFSKGFYLLVLFTCIVKCTAFRVTSVCASNVDCHSQFTQCDMNTGQCTCKPSHPLKLHNTMCVEVSKIGERCELSDSCRYFDQHAVCHSKRGCVCSYGYRLQRRLGPHDPGICVLKEGSNNFHPQSYFRGFDEDDDDDDDSSEDDDDENSHSDITTPVIVGLVLGTLIVCGWSFAICRLYLKRVEKQRLRSHRKRVRHTSSRPARVRSGPATLASPTLAQTQYTLLGFPIDPLSGSIEEETEEGLLTEGPPPPPRHASLSPDLNSIQTQSPSPPPFISPDEEPLPGYDISQKKEPEFEPPPSYDEVMKLPPRPT